MSTPAVTPLIAMTLVASAPAAAVPPCGPASIITGCGTQTGSGFQGAIIVPGSDAANAAVARSRGCEGCDWTVVPHGCDHQDAERDCNAARCPGGTTYDIFLQRPGDPAPTRVDTVCLTATRRIVTAAELAVDVERYLTDLTPPAATIVVQPDGRAVTKLATYFRATGPRADDTTLNVSTAAGPARLTIHITAGRYVWRFGDGTTCETAAPGAPYGGGDATEECGDRVAHVYQRRGDVTVTLEATWRGTYDFDVGYGPVGPLPIPGNGVTAAPQTRTVQVRDATAQLVGGPDGG